MFSVLNFSCDISQRQNKRKQPCRSSSADEATCRSDYRSDCHSDLSHSVSRPLTRIETVERTIRIYFLRQAG